MNTLKQHLSIDDQIALMKKRGLIIRDEQKVQEVLFNLNYYRLSGYLHNFKKPNSDCYIDGLSWERLKCIYDFDRKLTRILLFALEDVEETLKSRISYILTSKNPTDPLIYINPVIYKNYNSYLKFLAYFYKEVENNKNLPFVKHHVENYNGLLPMWVAVELLTMGNIHALYNNLETKYQKLIAQSYQTGPRQLASWIENLTYTRNHLAHYMRIYNFNFGRTPAKCKNHTCYSSTNMIYDQVHTISYMYSDKSEWNQYVIPEIKRIIDEYSDSISLSGIGFPVNWAKSIIL